MTDDVLQGVRTAREAFSASHGDDVFAMVAALQRMNEAGDWPVVSLPPRPPQVLAARVALPDVGGSAVDFPEVTA